MHLFQFWCNSNHGYLQFSSKAFKTSNKKTLPFRTASITLTRCRTQIFAYMTRFIVNPKPLEAQNTDNISFVRSEMTAKQAAVKLKLSKLLPRGIKMWRQEMWRQEQMNSVEDFLRWFDKKSFFSLQRQCKR